MSVATRYEFLGRSDLRLAVVGQGTGQFGPRSWGYGVSYGEADVMEVVRRDMEMGINVFDSAETYGNGLSERLLGKALSGYRREEYQIITKVAPWNLSYDGVIKAANNSLERLRTRVIDLYLVHYPNPFVPLKPALKAMETLLKQGRIRYFGTSNFNPLQLQRAQDSLANTEIIANEIEYNLISRRAEKCTIPYCLRQGIGVIAYSPLAGGVLTGRYSHNSLPRDRARAFNLSAKKTFLKKLNPLFKLLAGLAEKKGATVSQIALSWLMSQGTCVPIPAALTVEEAEINAAAIDVILSKPEISEINKNAPQLGPVPYYFDHLALRPIAWARESLKRTVMSG